MSPESEARSRRRRQKAHCLICEQSVSFLRTCTCGFAICEPCMQRDMWGFTCNGITWVCPDCGAVRSF